MSSQSCAVIQNKVLKATSLMIIVLMLLTLIPPFQLHSSVASRRGFVDAAKRCQPAGNEQGAKQEHASSRSSEFFGSRVFDQMREGLAVISSGVRALGKSCWNFVGALASPRAHAAVDPPMLQSVTPSSARSGTSELAVSITGRQFLEGITVKLTCQGYPDITATDIDVISHRKVKCRFDLSDVAPGYRGILITNPDNQSCTLENGFEISAPLPTISTITPGNAAVGDGNVIIREIKGMNYLDGATVKLTKNGKNDISADNVQVISSTTITCSFDLTDATTGKWDVVVSNPDNGYAKLKDGFKINHQPLIKSMDPNTASSGTMVNIERISGNHFQPDASVRLSKDGQDSILGTNITVISATKISCSFDLVGASLGAWELIVINPDQGFASLRSGFMVLSAPEVYSISPNNSGKGNTNCQVSLTGREYDPYITIKLEKGNKSIDGMTIGMVSDDRIDCVFDLENASPGT